MASRNLVHFDAASFRALMMKVCPFIFSFQHIKTCRVKTMSVLHMVKFELHDSSVPAELQLKENVTQWLILVLIAGGGVNQ